MNGTLFRYLLFLFLLSSFGISAQKISGTIRDTKTNESIIGAVISIKGTGSGTTTDLDGKFELNTMLPLPVTLVISFVGFDPLEVKVTSFEKSVNVKLHPKQVELKGVEVTGSRISDKQKQAPLTVESMDIIAIKECPQTSFYEGLGTLKGVDLTSASMELNPRVLTMVNPIEALVRSTPLSVPSPS